MPQLYHISPNSNRLSIATTGINPTFAKGNRSVTWWVDERRLFWAISHTAIRHGISENDVSVYVCNFHHKQITKTRRKGVFFCKTVVRPTAEIALMPLEESEPIRKELL